MVSRAVSAGLLLGGLAAGATLGQRYNRDLTQARVQLASLDLLTVDSVYGRIEYASTGSGPPVLVSHGILHGSDGGLLSVRSSFDGRRVIAPSRFGYLGSDLPDDADGAMQADAFVALLDRLDIEGVDAVGISAGTGPAVQLALRYPDRVDRLIISSGSFPDSPTTTAPPDWARVFYSDAAMWALKTLLPSVMARLMGVPKDFPHDLDEALYIQEMIDSIFPVGPRAPGALHDAYRLNPEIETYPLESISVPTMVIHAKDDPLASYPAAAAAADRIPGCELVTLESGGHLGVGQTDLMREVFNRFLSTPTSV